MDKVYFIPRKCFVRASVKHSSNEMHPTKMTAQTFLTIGLPYNLKLICTTSWTVIQPRVLKFLYW
jgi:hypothetical protein